MKALRWQGLLAFIAIVGGLALAFYLFAGTLIKWGMEAGGEEIFNAKVNVNKVELQYSPAGITVHGVSVGDENAAMRNLFEFEQATMQLRLLRLLMGQVIIEDMSLTGLAFDTERSKSGLLKKKPLSPEEVKAQAEEETLKEEISKGLKDAAAAAPDAKTLLAREPLKTDAAYKTLATSIDEKKKSWENLEKRLPNSNKLKSYEQDIKKLTSGELKSVADFNARKRKFDDIKKAMRADKKAIDEAKTLIKRSQKELKGELSNLKNAPKADYEHLKNKYGLNAGGVANLSGLLFGSEVGEYSNTFLYWYNKAQPYIARINEIKSEAEAEEPIRLEGRFIRFPEQEPLPDFLIKRGKLSMLDDMGEILILANNLTHQQEITGKPSTLTLSSKQWGQMSGLNADAILDYRQTPAVNTANFSVASLGLSKQKLSESNKLAVTMDKANGRLSGSAKLIDGKLDGDAKALFSKAKFSSDGKTQFAKEVGAALEKIHSFDLDIGFTGAVDELDLRIGSNLDSQLQKAFNQRFKEKQTEWRAKLDTALNERLNAYLKDLDPNLGLPADTNLLSKNGTKLDDLLKTQLQDYAKQQQDKAEAQAKKELEKQKAKAEAERKKQEEKLKKQAEEKLKNLFN
ncbi:TIGR03545 family protein [Agaribacterium sp. ZY112]|uniref:TIGR03545 family protein n=1 Tax=Agaribacterium sp. ZY112 TaxID=3233574 RepID=UPI0035251066